MAAVSTRKIKDVQLESHTIISTSPQESTCARCGGLMVKEFCMDLLFCIGESETKFGAQRCVQCGEVVDPVILHNRQHRPDSATGFSLRS